MNNFLDELVEKIVESSKLPRIQVERQISPFLEFFIESIINKLAKENKNQLSGNYKYIGSEFPLHKEEKGKEKKNDLHFNVDYLFWNETNNSLLFIELKTDSNSFDLEQYNNYNKIIANIIDNSAKEIYEFLDLLKNKKYKYYKDKTISESSNEIKWSKISDAELIYIAPLNINENRRWGQKKREAINEINFIHFKDLPEKLDADYSKEWEILHKNLLKLDEN